MPVLDDLACGAPADGERTPGGGIAEVIADIIDILRTGLLNRQQPPHLARLAGREAGDDVVGVHLMDFFEVLLQRRIDLLRPMTCDPVEVGSVLVEVMPLAVRRQHKPKPRRIAGPIGAGKSLDERNRSLMAAGVEGADVEFHRRLVLQNIGDHSVLRVRHVAENGLFHGV